MQSDAIDLLHQADRLQKPVVVHGLSMGSILAVRTAQDPKVAGLVLEGAITSVPQVVDATVPGWLRAFLPITIDPDLAALDNIPLVTRFDRPLLILVGKDDDETPPVLSERLYVAATGTHKSLLEVPKARHADTMTFDAAVQAYRHFLDQM